MPYRQVFGSENAADDELLEDCYIPPSGPVMQKPILIGKWGTGKTGLLIYRNRNLSKRLREIDPLAERIWYITETGLPIQTLKFLEEKCGEDRHCLKRLLEEMWKSEIARNYINILLTLRPVLKNKNGPHWDAISKFSGKTSRTSIWNYIPSAIEILLNKEKVDAAKSIVDQVTALYNETTFVHINGCLQDISNEGISTVLAIEPIETPTSDLENETDLAQLLVACLLNVYYKKLLPSSRQLINIEISIPWHRYTRDLVGEPQKLTPFIGRFRWNKQSLFDVLNRRIEWEFRRVRRNYSQKGSVSAWNMLFDSRVRNSVTGDLENSFDYIARHSQYRVRDILRFARDAVEQEASVRSSSVDDVILGQGGRRVTSKSIQTSVERISKATAFERIMEGNRRYPGLTNDVETLRGIHVPFTINDLKSRADHRIHDNRQIDILKMLANFWNCGIVGIQVNALSQEAIGHLKTSFDSINKTNIKSDTNKATFYVFDYNTDKNILDIINTFNPDVDTTTRTDIILKVVLHPMLFEYLDARVLEKHPIGV